MVAISTTGKHLAISTRLNGKLRYDLAILLLNLCPRENRCLHTGLYMAVHGSIIPKSQTETTERFIKWPMDIEDVPHPCKGILVNEVKMTVRKT